MPPPPKNLANECIWIVGVFRARFVCVRVVGGCVGVLNRWGGPVGARERLEAIWFCKWGKPLGGAPRRPSRPYTEPLKTKIETEQTQHSTGRAAEQRAPHTRLLTTPNRKKKQPLKIYDYHKSWWIPFRPSNIHKYLRNPLSLLAFSSTHRFLLSSQFLIFFIAIYSPIVFGTNRLSLSRWNEWERCSSHKERKKKKQRKLTVSGQCLTSTKCSNHFALIADKRFR